MTRFSQGSLLNIGTINDERDLPPLPMPPPSMSTTDSRSSFFYSDSASTGQLSRYSSERRSSLVSPEVLELEGMLYKFKEQLDFQRRRADAEERRATEAEKKVREVTEHLKSVNQARLASVRDATGANQELKLYKLQLESAQREIIRAQDVFDLVDRQRYAAEKQAAESRSKARRLNEELLIEQARREGRRLGMQEGLERGRSLRAPEPGVSQAYPDVDQTSFIEDDYESDDNRTVSADSFETTDSARNVRRSYSTVTTQPIHSPSPPPVPIPEPRSVPQGPQRTPSTIQRDIRPISIRNPSTTPRLGNAIPPDNFIPHLDTDNVIRIPPPYEFHRPPPTPDRQPSPSLTGHQEGDEPRFYSGTSQQSHRHSSPDSNSTTISQLDMVKNPHMPAANTPALSVILEVNSTHTSPHPQSLNNRDLRRQKSMSATSGYRGTGSVQGSANDRDTFSQRPVSKHHNRSTSSLASTAQRHNTPSIVGQGSRASVGLAHETPIQINVQPPSRPISDGAQSLLSKTTSTHPLSPLAADTVPLSAFSGGTGSVAGLSTHSMPGGIYNPSFTDDVDDDAVSSRISGDDFFTTPPPSGVPRSWASPSPHDPIPPMPSMVATDTTAARSGWGLDSEFESNKNDKRKKASKKR